MFLSHITPVVSFQLYRELLSLMLRISPPVRQQGTMRPDARTVSLYGFVMVWSLSGRSMFFPLLTIIPWASNICFLLRSFNSKMAPFSISACGTSMLIIHTIEAALVLTFGAIQQFREVFFHGEINFGSLVYFRCITHNVSNVICRSPAPINRSYSCI